MKKTPAFIVLRALGLETTVIELVSPLRRDECVRRLRDHADAGFGISAMRPVMGNVGDTSFMLRQRTGYRNSFATLLRGTFEEEARRTRVHCRLGVHPFVRAFMLVWLVGVFIGACVLGFHAVSPLIGGTASRASLPIANILAPAMMLVFGIVLAKAGRNAARGQQDYLIAFLVRWLDARETPAAGG
jgi:hypothetical protein